MISTFQTFFPMFLELKILFIFILLPFYISAEGIYGVDTIFPLTAEKFECIKVNGSYSFFIGRIHRSLGGVDEVGVENIITARKAGWNFVDAYFIPCLKDHCPTAKKQIEETLNYTVVKGAQIGILWISIPAQECNQTLSWPLVQNCNGSWTNWPWSSNFTFNQAFLLEMVKQAESMGYRVGIYSTIKRWGQVFGKEWNGVSDKPLWYAHFTKNFDFSDFEPFGGWKIPSMHNFKSDYSDDCKVAINPSWYPEGG